MTTKSDDKKPIIVKNTSPFNNDPYNNRGGKGKSGGGKTFNNVGGKKMKSVNVAKFKGGSGGDR